MKAAAAVRSSALVRISPLTPLYPCRFATPATEIDHLKSVKFVSSMGVERDMQMW